MKLVLVIIEDNDAVALMDALIEHRFGATKLASTGGFLLRGNTTVMIGAEDSRIDELIELVRRICKPRKRIVPQTTGEIPSPAAPFEVDAGGATLFVLDINRFEKI